MNQALQIWLMCWAFWSRFCYCSDKHKNQQLMLTHLGYLPKQCILQVTNDIEIVHTSQGTFKINSNSNTKTFHPILPECIKATARFNNRFSRYSNTTKHKLQNQKFPENSKKSMHHTNNNYNQKPINKFTKFNKFTKNHNSNNNRIKKNSNKNNSSVQDQEDWIAWTFNANYPTSIASLTGNYDIPAYEPSSQYDNQLIYYNYGLECTASDSTTWDLEPLVTYCGAGTSGVCNGTLPNGYAIVASECCYNGYLLYGTPYSISVGSQGIYVSMSTTSTSSVTTISYGSESSSLTVNYDESVVWELVFVVGGQPENSDYSCNDYPDGEFYVYNMRGTDEDGSIVSGGYWDEGAFSSCGAYVNPIDRSLDFGKVGIYLSDYTIMD